MTRSIFRPRSGIDQSLLAANDRLVETIKRRSVLKGAVSLGALTLLSGCDVTNERSVQSILTAMSSWNDTVQTWLFDPKRLAPTFSLADVVDPPRYNAYYPIEDVKPVDLTSWKLELGGLISDKRPWTPGQFEMMPQQEMIIRHVCVEGWDYVGQWSGVNLKSFLEKVGADLTAKYVAFRSYDGYVSSLDMASAIHPQTILATRYAGRPLTEPFGAPLRLRTAVKLGFKNPKWLTAIEVTNNYPGGYWEDRGYNWFSGM